MTIIPYSFNGTDLRLSADLHHTHAKGDDGKVGDVTAVRGHLLKTAGEGPGGMWAESGWVLGFD